jgi:hypothetical protein
MISFRYVVLNVFRCQIFFLNMLLPLGYKGNTNTDFYFVGCISEEYALRHPVSDEMDGKSFTHRSELLMCCVVILRNPKFNFSSRFSESSKRNLSRVNG